MICVDRSERLTGGEESLLRIGLLEDRLRKVLRG